MMFDAVADPGGGANPAMAPPFNLVIEFGPPSQKNKNGTEKRFKIFIH